MPTICFMPAGKGKNGRRGSIVIFEISFSVSVVAQRRVNKFVDKFGYAQLVCLFPEMTGYPRKFPFGFTQECAVVDHKSVIAEKI